MASETFEGRRRPKHSDGHNSCWCRTLDTGLPLLTPDEERGDRISDLRIDADTGAPCEPLRSDAGASPGGSGRQDCDGERASDSGGLCFSDDRDGEDGLRGEDERVSPLKALESSELPDVSDGHWRQALKAASTHSSAGLRDGDGVLDKSAALEACTDKALEVAYELMHSDNADEDVVRLNNMRANVAKTVIAAQLRVDENLLRRKQLDILPKIIAEAEIQKRLLEL